MKNHWIMKKQDKDSLQQMSEGNLDIPYEWQYTHEEEVVFEKNEGADPKYCYGHMSKTHILEKCVIGTYEGQVFQDDGKGRLRMNDNGKLVAMIHYETGTITIPKELTDKSLVVSYEWNWAANERRQA